MTAATRSAPRTRAAAVPGPVPDAVALAAREPCGGELDAVLAELRRGQPVSAPARPRPGQDRRPARPPDRLPRRRRRSGSRCGPSRRRCDSASTRRLLAERLPTMSAAARLVAVPRAAQHRHDGAGRCRLRRGRRPARRARVRCRSCRAARPRCWPASCPATPMRSPDGRRIGRHHPQLFLELRQPRARREPAGRACAAPTPDRSPGWPTAATQRPGRRAGRGARALSRAMCPSVAPSAGCSACSPGTIRPGCVALLLTPGRTAGVPGPAQPVAGRAGVGRPRAGAPRPRPVREFAAPVPASAAAVPASERVHRPGRDARDRPDGTPRRACWTSCPHRPGTPKPPGCSRCAGSRTTATFAGSVDRPTALDRGRTGAAPRHPRSRRERAGRGVRRARPRRGPRPVTRRSWPGSWRRCRGWTTTRTSSAARPSTALAQVPPWLFTAAAARASPGSPGSP